MANRAEFERETAEVCQTYNIGVIPYSPLAGGFLTGKYQQGAEIPASARADGAKRRYFNARGWSILAAIEDVARQRDNSISQIALGWLLTSPIVTSPIIGPRTVAQLEDNIGAVGLRLSPEEKDTLDKISDWREQ